MSKAEQVTDSVNAAIGTGSNYNAFVVCFGIGVFFLLMAFTCLPFVMISPAKFNWYFSLGSIFIQLSLAFFYGPANYIKTLFKRENLIISCLYFVSVFFAFYSSIIWGTYFSSLIILVLQVVTLGYFVMQAVSGGDQATQKLQSMVVGGAVDKALTNIGLKSQPKTLFEF